jgi:hypothetical protein
MTGKKNIYYPTISLLRYTKDTNMLVLLAAPTPKDDEEDSCSMVHGKSGEGLRLDPAEVPDRLEV